MVVALRSLLRVGIAAVDSDEARKSATVAIPGTLYVILLDTIIYE